MKRKISMIIMLCAVFMSYVSISAPKKEEKKIEKAEIGKTAPDFTLNSYDGKKVIKFSEHIKGKAALLNFFGTWCPPCRSEAPEFVKIYDEYKDKNVVFLSVALEKGDPEKAVGRFISQYKIKWAVVLDNNREVSTPLYDVSNIPTNIVIDKSGKITYISSGEISGKVLKAELERALESKAEQNKGSVKVPVQKPAPSKGGGG